MDSWMVGGTLGPEKDCKWVLARHVRFVLAMRNSRHPEDTSDMGDLDCSLKGVFKSRVTE